jgi:hypothetical protein
MQPKQKTTAVPDGIRKTDSVSYRSPERSRDPVFPTCRPLFYALSLIMVCRLNKIYRNKLLTGPAKGYLKTSPASCRRRLILNQNF